jgi:proline iminopeptidase
MVKSTFVAVLFAAALAGSAFAQPPATESGFIQVEPDVRLFYQRFGTGTPTVFIPMRSELAPNVAPLLERFDVVMWDARGFGLSDRPDDLTRFGLDHELADAEAVRKHFGAERIYYVGGSLWGSVAMLYAARHPSSVAGVVAMAPLAIEARLMEGSPERAVVHDLSAQIAEVEAMKSDGRIQSDPYGYCVADYRVGFADSYVDLANFARLEQANLCQYANWHWHRAGPVVFEGIFGSFGEWNWRDELANVEVPVMLLYGDHEVWPLEGVRAYTDVLPNVGWKEFADAGHHVWNERNDEVLAMMATFFGGTWPTNVER